MSLPWFRVYSNIVDNDKVRLVSFDDRWFFIAILACKQQGILDADQPHDLKMRRVAVKLGVTVRELEEIGKRLGEVDLVDPQTLNPSGWDERQYPSDTDPTAAERARRYRERKKQLNGESRVTSRVTDRDASQSVTRLDTDTDTDTEGEEDARARDHPPPHPFDPPPRPPVTTPIPANFQPDETTLYRIHTAGKPPPSVADILKFVAHYQASGEAKADWQAQFVKWWLSEYSRDMGRGHPQQRRPGQLVV